jgi:hypothetical protein
VLFVLFVWCAVFSLSHYLPPIIFSLFNILRTSAHANSMRLSTQQANCNYSFPFPVVFSPSWLQISQTRHNTTFLLIFKQIAWNRKEREIKKNTNTVNKYIMQLRRRSESKRQLRPHDINFCSNRMRIEGRRRRRALIKRIIFISFIASSSCMESNSVE